ncbi:MAG: hypothetical protein ACO24H_10845, partial [Polynucleobacter sp.]
MMQKRSFKTILVVLSLTLSLLTPASAPALSFNTIPATKWGYIYGSGKTANLNTAPTSQNADIGPA